jgi:hypothetical protein
VEKKQLLDALKQVKIFVKGKYRLSVQASMKVDAGRLTITIPGTQVYVPCRNEGLATFTIYFLDFYEAIKNNKAYASESIECFVSQRTIQFEGRNLTLLSADLSQIKTNKTVEAPLGSLNYVDNMHVSLYTVSYALKGNKNQVFLERSINNDLLQVNAILRKYDVSYSDLSNLVYQNLKKVVTK